MELLDDLAFVHLDGHISSKEKRIKKLKSGRSIYNIKDLKEATGKVYVTQQYWQEKQLQGGLSLETYVSGFGSFTFAGIPVILLPINLLTGDWRRCDQEHHFLFPSVGGPSRKNYRAEPKLVGGGPG